MKMIKKIVSSLLCVSMIVASAATTLAATYPVSNPTNSITTKNPDTAENNLSISKTVAPTGTDNEYKITFSMPSQDSTLSKTVDVALVIDKSSVSGGASEIKAAAENLLDKMRETVDNDSNVHYNVGVLVYKDIIMPTSTSGLLDISDDANLQSCKDAITTASGAGSNVEMGVLTAYDWLKSAPAADAKYMINLTDYAGYLLADENLQPLHRYIDNAMQWQSYGGAYNPTLYKNATLAQVTDLIDNGIMLNGTDNSSNPYLIDKGAAGGEGPGSTMTNADFNLPSTPTMGDKSVYHVAHDLQDIKASGIKVMSVTRDYHSSAELAGLFSAFQQWIDTNIGPVYNLDQGATVDDSFAKISSEVLYQMGKGELTDTVGSYFDYVPGSVDITVDGTSYPAETIAENHWGYDIDGQGNYAFEVTYDEATDTFNWKINRPIEKTKYAYFSYNINLDEAKAQELGAGDYHLLTNGEAYMDYMTSLEANNGVTEYTKHVDLASPAIEYNVAGGISPDADGNINIIKKWSATPTDAVLSFDIYESGQKIDTITMDAGSGWTTQYYVGTASNAIASLSDAEEASPSDATDDDGALAEGIVENDLFVAALGIDATQLSRKFTVIEQAYTGYTTSYAYDEATHSVTVTNTKNTTPSRPTNSSSSSSSSSSTYIASSGTPSAQTPPVITEPIPDSVVPAGVLGLPKTGEESLPIWPMLISLIVMIGAVIGCLKKANID